MKYLRITLPEKKVATQAMRDFAESLIPQLEEAMNGREEIQSVSVVVKIRNNGMQKVELTVTTEKNSYRRELSGEDYYDILPIAFNEVEKAIYKHRDILKTKQKRYGNKAKEEYELEVFGDYAEKEETLDEPFIKFKKVDRVQMTVDVAIEQLEKTGYEFFLYDDAETGEARVVYIREDGGYGVIY